MIRRGLELEEDWRIRRGFEHQKKDWKRIGGLEEDWRIRRGLDD
jgi:hypothetical protein